MNTIVTPAEEFKEKVTELLNLVFLLNGMADNKEFMLYFNKIAFIEDPNPADIDSLLNAFFNSDLPKLVENVLVNSPELRKELNDKDMIFKLLESPFRIKRLFRERK